MPTKNELVKAAILKHPNKSNTAIANQTKVSLRSVERARQELTEAGEVKKPEPHVKTVDEHLEERRENAKIKMLTQQNGQLIRMYEQLMEKYEHALLLKEVHPVCIPR